MIAWVAYRMADLVVRLLPAGIADRLCVALARLAFHAGLPARRAQEANLARLLGDAPRGAIRARARESFEHFALALSDFLRLDSMAPEALAGAIEIHGEEVIGGFERAVIVAVLDVRTKAPEPGHDRLSGLRMHAELARELEQLQCLGQRDG